MTMTQRSILVGQIWHEGHSFNPIRTREEDFIVLRGPQLLDEARATSTALSGIVKTAEALGYQCVPAISARTRPGGAIEQEAFERIADQFVDAARQGGFDAICLDLHGATLAEKTLDSEGYLLGRLRDAVGPDMMISVALDLHAYLTPEMVEHATVMTSFRTTPHADIEETGARAMRLLDGLLDTGTAPRAVYSLIPFLTRGNDETWSGPLLGIHAAADEWRSRPDVTDLSIFNVHPFLDVPGYGQVVLAYDMGAGSAVAACKDLSERLWDARDQFQEQLMSVNEALTIAQTSGQLLALGDQGDRVMGAGPGDSPEIARIALRDFPDLKVAVPVYDPQAVARAREAGENAVLRMPVGGGFTLSVDPLEADWTVVRLCRARFTNIGPYMAGTEADFGNAAVLKSGAVTVIVTDLAPNVHDPAFYEAVGIPLAGQQVVVARAANHYKLSFAGIARTITVDTPGLTAFRPHQFPFSKARPFHPLDRIDWKFTPRLYDGGHPSRYPG
ncbi:M81 family peptidase (plasmid) [Azospirillum argentinense]|uniref:Microcystinase C n=2 Tax=Azospirillum argentinense TaxID=2970906 RepID=A0A4D8PNN0_9PROT|nr:M81 family peptidase [Azospirillum argentinense]